MRLVVVGNGVAGMQAALEARRRAPDCRITVVSEESDDCFSRTALMYVLCGQLSYGDSLPYGADAYERHDLERVRARVVGLDTDARLLRLAGLPPVSYDRLVVASGSRPRPPPWPGAELHGVGHLVTLQDLAWLEQELHGGPSYGGPPPRADAHLAHTEAGSPYRRREAAAERRGALARRPVVIGGGLIGVEVVEALLAAGHRPTFVVREEWFAPLDIDRREAAFVTEHLVAHGVDVRLGCEVEALEGDDDGDVSGVRTDRGTLPADLVVVAIGVQPNTEWLGGALQLDASGGVVVDAQLRASVDVWAAGDCASVPADGGRQVEQLWYTARDQGRVAGCNAAGGAETYARGTWYNAAKLMDVEYTTVGRPGRGDDWFYEEPGPIHSTTRITHRDGAVVGFSLLGRRWDPEVLIRWIEEGRPLPWVLDHLEQAGFDTELVPPLRIPQAARP